MDVIGNPPDVFPFFFTTHTFTDIRHGLADFSYGNQVLLILPEIPKIGFL